MTKLFSSRPIWNHGILLVRLFAGWFIIRHSLELFNPDSMKQLLDFLTSTKFPFPIFSGYAAKIIEFAGGILLAIGFLTRWVTPLLMIVMAGVIYTMNGGNIFDGEHAFLFLLLFALFFFQGPGQWSLDYWFFDKGKQVEAHPSRTVI
jgi:putative oxidoreductase